MNDSSFDWMKKDSLGFNIAEQVGGVLGTLACAQALGATGIFGSASGATSAVGVTSSAGIKSATAVAAVSGFGHGTENAWNDGADTGLGMVYGLARGVFDGLQYWLGGQINSIVLGSGNSIASKLGSAAFRVALDGVDGGIEVPAESVLKSIYNKKSFDENFNEAGGWGAVGSQFLLGAGISAASEGGQALFKKIFLKKKLDNLDDLDVKKNINGDIDIDDSLSLIKKMFIWYSKCSTCRKAYEWLKNNNIEFNVRSIVDDNPTSEELTNWIKKSGLDIKRFFNTSGIKYKELNLKEKLINMSEEDKIRLLASDGMLVKRPLFIRDNIILVGFKESEWNEKLKK